MGSRSPNLLPGDQRTRGGTVFFSEAFTHVLDAGRDWLHNVRETLMYQQSSSYRKRLIDDLSWGVRKLIIVT
jgi:hypothetical protein